VRRNQLGLLVLLLPITHTHKHTKAPPAGIPVQLAQYNSQYTVQLPVQLPGQLPGQLPTPKLNQKGGNSNSVQQSPPPPSYSMGCRDVAVPAAAAGVAFAVGIACASAKQAVADGELLR
jgi:hypothetical protein